MKADPGSTSSAPVSEQTRERAPAWWVVVAAVLAPLMVAGSWGATESMQHGGYALKKQHGGYDPLKNSISLLASHVSTDRWVMESGIIVVATCLIVTAIGLRGVRLPGRVLLCLAGLAAYGIAGFPMNPGIGGNPLHTSFTAAAEFTLLFFPLSVMSSRDNWPQRPFPLSAQASFGAFFWLAGAAAWMASSSRGIVPYGGAAERVTILSDVLWPAIVVFWMWLAGGGSDTARRLLLRR